MGNDIFIMPSCWDKETGENYLEGVSMQDAEFFYSIVLKQLQKGVRIKINYLEIDRNNLANTGHIFGNKDFFKIA